jgi:Na+/alanine symporter
MKKRLIAIGLILFIVATAVGNYYLYKSCWYPKWMLRSDSKLMYPPISIEDSK